MCSTSLSILPKSPASQPIQAHTVTCSCVSSSSGRRFVGELGTSPSVSEDIEPASSIWLDVGVARKEESPNFCLLAGGMSASAANRSCSSSPSKASEERSESGEPTGESSRGAIMNDALCLLFTDP